MDFIRKHHMSLFFVFSFLFAMSIVFGDSAGGILCGVLALPFGFAANIGIMK